jgi:23S rRNA (pseudouridine1915-N3)-methyltransferase
VKIELLAAGTKPPKWIVEGVSEYQKRMPRECRLEIRELAIAKRVKNDSIERFMLEEEKGFRQQVKKGAKIISLDSTGKMMTTRDLAKSLERWMGDSSHVQMLIGGPDGLSKGSLDLASESWSLSRLTFPHFLVRVLVAEQLYRAWSVLKNHPYHK